MMFSVCVCDEGEERKRYQSQTLVSKFVSATILYAAQQVYVCYKFVKIVQVLGILACS